jgi:hypothetical protein
MLIEAASAALSVSLGKFTVFESDKIVDVVADIIPRAIGALLYTGILGIGEKG